MKNRRNTRRGRAKRWAFKGTSHVGQWLLWPSTWVYTYDDIPGWYATDLRNPAETSFPSRAAAMRAAEHLARQ
jgi:hypothetical protein